jgi:hypothetical protein
VDRAFGELLFWTNVIGEEIERSIADSVTTCWLPEYPFEAAVADVRVVPTVNGFV